VTTRVFILANGDVPDLEGLVPNAAQAQLWIAADGGAEHFARLGLTPGHIVGDLDSVSTETLSQMQQAGSQIHQHPVDKDATDLELALSLVPAGSEVVIAGALGDRWDQSFANLLLLARPDLRGLRLQVQHGADTVHVLHGPGQLGLAGTPGDIVSLLPVHGPATGITLSGLRYPLANETLHPGQTRGVSNVLANPAATIELTSGTLIVIHRGRRTK
jgi:thiamine pyrophosphokinase